MRSCGRFHRPHRCLLLIQSLIDGSQLQVHEYQKHDLKLPSFWCLSMLVVKTSGFFFFLVNQPTEDSGHIYVKIEAFKTGLIWFVY
jgi:hypothetical protein